MLTKQADFIESALQTIKDKSHLISRPFETIFGAMLPAMVWPASKFLSALLFIAEALGYGPGLLGRLIDDALGIGGKEPDLSDANLKQASSSVIGKLFEGLGVKGEAFVKELRLVKKTFDTNDLVAIAAYIKHNDDLTKTARGAGLRTFWRQMVRGKRLGFSNALWWILKTFAKGLIGLGLVGGAIGVVKQKVAPSTTGLMGLPLPKEEGTKNMQLIGRTDVYLNTKHNVEDTLIQFLDSAYKVKPKDGQTYIPFSKMFENLNGYGLKNSKELDGVLRIVEGLNWGSIDYIDQKRTFVGPKLEDLAKRLIPVMSLELGGGAGGELSKALRGVYK